MIIIFNIQGLYRLNKRLNFSLHTDTQSNVLANVKMYLIVDLFELFAIHVFILGM